VSIELRAGPHDLPARAAFARHVREPVRFFARELAGSRTVARYRLRRGDVAIHLRHSSGDIVTYDEVVVRDDYAPPAEALDALGSEPLTIADLGANIGLFTAMAIGRWSVRQVLAFEPDDESRDLLERTALANAERCDVVVHAACAGVAEGRTSFLAGRQAVSHAVATGTEGAISVPVRDAFPAIAAADLVKMDIEGGEWPILADARFASLGARAVVLEYHVDGCPGTDPAACAGAALTAAGFEVGEPVPAATPGYGTLWAWRAR
jgi:FkbM family methyltransferase